MTEHVSYVYAVAREGDVPSETLAGLVGVGGGPVHLVHAAGLAAVVSDAPAADYAEAALRARLSDLTWLETVARAHDGVVAALTAHVATLPMRLATIYRDAQRVRAMLIEQAEEFGDLLDAFVGHVELGVKVYAEPEPPPTPRRTAPIGPRAAGAGRAYLRQRQEALRGQQDLTGVAARCAGRVDAEARRFARQRRAHRPQDSRLSGRAGVNVLNVAYLVRREHEEDVRQVARAAAADFPGARVEVTGPWAPYSFIDAPVGRADHANAESADDSA